MGLNSLTAKHEINTKKDKLYSLREGDLQFTTNSQYVLCFLVCFNCPLDIFVSLMRSYIKTEARIPATCKTTNMSY